MLLPPPPYPGLSTPMVSITLARSVLYKYVNMQLLWPFGIIISHSLLKRIVVHNVLLQSRQIKRHSFHFFWRGGGGAWKLWRISIFAYRMETVMPHRVICCRGFSFPSFVPRRLLLISHSSGMKFKSTRDDTRQENKNRVFGLGFPGNQPG